MHYLSFTDIEIESATLHKAIYICLLLHFWGTWSSWAEQWQRMRRKRRKRRKRGKAAAARQEQHWIQLSCWIPPLTRISSTTSPHHHIPASHPLTELIWNWKLLRQIEQLVGLHLNLADVIPLPIFLLFYDWICFLVREDFWNRWKP